MHNPLRSRSSRSSRLMQWADTPCEGAALPTRLLHGLLRLLCITYREMQQNDIPLRSAALTYTVLLSLVPILAMSTAVVKGLGGSDQLRDVVYSYIATLDYREQTPDMPAGLTTHLLDAADRLFDYVDKTNFTTLGSFGVAGILVSVILVFGTIEMALNAIWHVRKSRSLRRKIADYLTLIVLLPLSINVTLAASAFLTSPTLSYHFQLLVPLAWLQTLILRLIPVFFITLTFYVVYIYFPNTRVHTVPALLGAALAGFMWFAFQNAYIRLQIGVSNYNAIYGSFATLPLFLVWMYLGWLFVLIGSQLAYAFQHLHSYRLLPQPSVPAWRLSAALDIMEAVQEAFGKNVPMTMENLEELLPEYGGDLLREVSETLVAAHLLHVSTTQEQLLPAGPAAVVGRRPVIEAVLGSDPPDTQGGAVSRRALLAATQSPETLQTQDGDGPDPGNLQDGQSST